MTAGRGRLENLDPAHLTGARRTQAELWQVAGAHDVSQREDVRRWIESLRRRGRLARLAVDDPAALLSSTLDGVAWLLANRDAAPDIPLPVAAVQLGDGHTLDPGTLVEDALVALSGSTDVRAAWQAFGVQLDDVSSSALTYMLPGSPDSIAGAAKASAQPLRVTHRMGDRGFGLGITPGDVISVCENASIAMLAADHLADACGHSSASRARIPR